MQITVFGASGKVGLLVVEQALKRGYKINAFVHSHDLFSPSNKLYVLKGDIYNADDVNRALQGSDAVVSCLGSWGTEHRNVLTSAMQNIIPAMTEQNIRRIVTLTGSGAAAPGTKGHRTLLKLLAPFPAGKVFRDGEEHMRVLASSNLQWTTLRSPIMHNFGSSSYRLSMKASNPAASISRKAVATALLDQLDSTDYLGKAPVLHRQ